MEIRYSINSRVETDECGNRYTSYGISAFRINSDLPFKEVYGVFLHGHEASRLAGLCTELELSPDHLDDVIADAIAAR